MLVDLALKFPEGELTLVCGSGKTLLLLGMSKELDVLPFSTVLGRHHINEIVCPPPEL